MEERNGERRSLETPRRNRSRSRRSQDCESARFSRSRSHRVLEREQELKIQQERVRLLELELQRERRHRSERRGTRNSRSRSRSRLPAAATGRDPADFDKIRCPKPLIKCNYCQRVGHKPELCNLRPDGGSAKADTVAKTMCISSSNPSNIFIKEIVVEGKPLQAFIDLGSEVTLIAQSSFEKLGVSHDQTTSIMKGFGNNLVCSIGSAKLNLSIDGVNAIVPCRIVQDQFLEKPVLIGQSYTEQPHIVIYKDVNKLQFFHVDIELPSYELGEDGHHLERARILSYCKLYGSASVKARIETPFTSSVAVNTKIVGKPGEEFIVCGGVYEVRNGLLFITITPCTIPCSLLENSIFARVERVVSVYRLGNIKDSAVATARPKVPPVKELDESLVRLGESVSSEDRAKLLHLLQRHKQCFAYDLSDLGCTNAIEMKIELSSQRPVKGLLLGLYLDLTLHLHAWFSRPIPSETLMFSCYGYVTVIK
ncbi:hypothetical protein ACJJTC_000086 [Scirpophaga incertulas]